MTFTYTHLKARKRWRVEYRLNGTRYRPVFPTREQAEGHAADVRERLNQAGARWAALSERERFELLALHQDALAAGVSLRAALDAYQSPHLRVRVTTGEGFQKFIAEQETRRLAPKTLAALRSNVGRFVQGRTAMALTDVRREDVLGWLQTPGWGARTFNSYLTSVNTFFRWCVATGCLEKSPAATIPKIAERRMQDLDEPPHILSLEQTAALLRATWRNDPKLIRYPAFCLFAGLRPDREAPNVQPADLHEPGKIWVRGLHAKDRQARYVDIAPVLADWLKLGAAAEWQPRNLRRRFQQVRAQAGLVNVQTVAGHARPEVIWTGWGQDVMRHTFASHYFAVHGAERTIEQLGHGDYHTLFGHYRRAGITRQRGLAYLGLTPDQVLRPPKK